MSRALERDIFLRCSVRHAFATFTGKVDLWWPPTHRKFESSTLTLDPVVGGAFVETTGDGRRFVLGEVLDCAPPHRICYSWNPGRIAGPTRVEVRFAPEGAGTRVAITHAEATAAMGDDWPARAALFARGWGLILPALAAFVANPPQTSP